MYACQIGSIFPRAENKKSLKPLPRPSLITSKLHHPTPEKQCHLQRPHPCRDPCFVCFFAETPEPTSYWRHGSTGFPKQSGKKKRWWCVFVWLVVSSWMRNRRLSLMSHSIFIVEVELTHRFHWKKYGFFFVTTFFVQLSSLVNLTVFLKELWSYVELEGR